MEYSPWDNDPINRFIGSFNEEFRDKPHQDRYTIHVTRRNRWTFLHKCREHCVCDTDQVDDWCSEFDRLLREIGYKVIECGTCGESWLIYEIRLVSNPDYPDHIHAKRKSDWVTWVYGIFLFIMYLYCMNKVVTK